MEQVSTRLAATLSKALVNDTAIMKSMVLEFAELVKKAEEKNHAQEIAACKETLADRFDELREATSYKDWEPYDACENYIDAKNDLDRAKDKASRLHENILQAIDIIWPAQQD